METAEAVLSRLVHILTDINTTLFDSWPIALLTGITLCFFGLKMFRLSLFIFGCLIGAIIGFGLGDLVMKPWGSYAGAVVLGALGGYGFSVVAKLAGFITGAVVGAMACFFLLGASGWIIPVTLGSGICASLFLSYFVMVGTAGWGAILVVGGLSALLQPLPGEHQYLLARGGIVLFLLGLGYQLFTRLKRS